ncbi:DUF3822 family protein [Pedobacter sp. ASV12]|uniref:DUF3822 family protein n=1 Tax=Pedobacter sp. ASV12 TaxID=2795120 RepID=UPI0018EBFF2C|nr:DUF3822 family protein [Pedobacter sp. ASV12]
MNSSNSILLIDPNFDPAKVSACNLLIKVGQDSFSYAIVNKETQQVNAVFDEQECENGLQKLSDRLKTDHYLTLPYQKVKVAVHTPNVIAVPNELYSEQLLANHTPYFIGSHTGSLYQQAHSHFGFTTVFALSKTAEDTLNSFNLSQLFTLDAGLLALAQNIGETGLLIDFTASSFQVLYLKNKQVVFQQNYEIDNLDEFNYYLLLIINQLGIEPKETPLFLSGIVHEGDERYNCLAKYFAQLQFVNGQPELDQSILDDMPSHYYSNLLALDQCE